MKKKLRVFEAFAGIGAQATALKRLGIDFEIVGISEWFTDAIICYDALHCNELDDIELPSYDEQLKYLKQFQFSRDSVQPCQRIESLGAEVIADLYRANIRTKNLGSITQITGDMMPDSDLLVYSFPCQDQGMLEERAAHQPPCLPRFVLDELLPPAGPVQDGFSLCRALHHLLVQDSGTSC